MDAVLQPELVPSRTFSLEYELQLSASPERVFAALTDEVGRWWPHCWGPAPHAVTLEPFPGGRFYEQTTADGFGTLYGIVERFEPPYVLQYRGSMGMGKAVQFVFSIELKAQAGGTLLKEWTHAVGAVSEKMRDGFLRGSANAYAVHMKDWIEQGVSLR